jgi:hypothetical protein
MQYSRWFLHRTISYGSRQHPHGNFMTDSMHKKKPRITTGPQSI